MTHKNTNKILICALIAICWAIYYPGLYGGWVFDDFHNIVKNQDILAIEASSLKTIWDATWSSHAGIFKRPLSMLTFALNYAAFGMDAFYFKVTNVIIHSVNGIIVYCLTKSILNFTFKTNHHSIFISSWMPIAVTALWMLHPIQMSSVLYVVQRMNSLSATFILLGLLFYIKGRIFLLKENKNGLIYILSTFLLFLPLASLSKENGVLLIPLTLLCELVFFKFKANNKIHKISISAIYLIFIAIPFLLFITALVLRPDFFIAGFAGRDFTLEERLLTQARLIFIYASWILIPNISKLGLYHDDITLSSDIITPTTNIYALIGLAIILIYITYSIFRKRENAPLIAFSLGFYLIAHSMESSFLPLEMVHEHRNYLPSFGLIFLLSYLLLKAFQILENKHLKYITFFLLILFFIASTLGTFQRSKDWSHPFTQAAIDAMNHPNSARSQVAYGSWLEQMAALENTEASKNSKLKEALALYKHASNLEDYALTPHINWLRLENQVGDSIKAQEILEIINNKLQEPPLSPATTEALISFIECNNSGYCDFSESEILKMVYSIRKNPMLNSRQEARIISQMIPFLLKKELIGEAIAFAQEARFIDPNEPQVRMNYAELLYKSGYIDAAQEEMRDIEKLEMKSYEKSRFSKLRKIIH